MKYKVTLQGRTYEVEVINGEARLLDEYDAVTPAAPVAAAPAPAAVETPAAPAAAPAVTGEGVAVPAPMPGTILKVVVQNGQAVHEGDVLCVLEAMKMENEIMAPKSGTVTQVVVSKGASVNTGDALVVIS